MYREIVDEGRDEVRGDVLLLLDASGRAGAAARDGYRGADGGGAGADGSPGGHAGAAEAGAAGGRVVVTLRDEGTGAVAIEGTRLSHDGREERVSTRREIGDHGPSRSSRA